MMGRLFRALGNQCWGHLRRSVRPESGGWPWGARGEGVSARTFAEEHLWRDVIWSPDQRVCQTPLVLLARPLLQRLQPVPTPTVRHVIPEVAGLHAVLSDVVPFGREPGVVKKKEGKPK